MFRVKFTTHDVMYSENASPKSVFYVRYSDTFNTREEAEEAAKHYGFMEDADIETV